jgi:hypothetical protein
MSQVSKEEQQREENFIAETFVKAMNLCDGNTINTIALLDKIKTSAMIYACNQQSEGNS